MFDKLAADVGGRSLRNCSLQDLMKARKSEVDLINGLVVDEAARYGLDAQANKVIVDLTHEIEAGRLAPGPENMALILERLQA
jgi:2-dehydropantoate 2-reductase